MAGYDPKKAAAYNKLRQQGLSDEAAFQQSGISNSESDNYVVNDVPGDTGRGTIGPAIIGTGTITQAPTAAEQRESAQFYKGLESSNFERVDYPVKADSRVSTKTVSTYTSTSTEQVSGGGERTITAGVAKANDRSTALQAQSDTKSAELKQYLAENPRNGNYTPEQAAARREKVDSLVAERGRLATAAEDAKTPSNPTETIVPNTTTNTSTTTFSQSSTNSAVETTAGPDPALNQEPTLDDTQVDAARAQAAEDPYNSAADNQEFVQNDEPAPSDSPYESQREQQNEQIETQSPDSVDPSNSPYASQREQQNEQIEAVSVSEAADQENPYAEGAGVEPPSAAAVAENDALAAAGAAGSQEAATKQRAQEQQALQARFNTPANGDWRVRIRLAPNSTYLYNATMPGILAPLKASDGVIFPYTPTISTTYSANYDVTDLTHSNYKGQFYKNSSVGEVAVNGVFTAQDTQEAEYMLAVIHFFRSVTKMFYGQDAERGTPPPLVYLFGLGQYQFNNHPCVVKTFNYSLPNDVDYIRTQPNNYGQNLLNRRVKESNAPSNNLAGTIARIGNAVDKLGNLLNIGALPKFGSSSAAGGPGVAQQAVNNTSNATYVPTKIEIQITLMPIQTRSQVSQQFSLKGFANGDLLRGGFW
jgi:hypothetical protein